MDTASTENLLYIGIAAVVIVFSLIMILQGWMMKLAVRICGGDEIGIFYGVSALTLSTLAGCAATALFAVLLPGTSPFIALFASLAGSVLTLCLMLRMGPIRAFAVYLTQGFLSIFAVGAVGAICAACVYFLVPAETLNQFAEKAKDRIGNVNPAAVQAFDGQDGNGVDVNQLNGLKDLFNQSFETQFSNGSDQGSVESDLNSESPIRDTLRNALFGGNEVPESFENPQVPAMPKAKASGTKQEEPLQSPYDNKIRSNPFVN